MGSNKAGYAKDTLRKIFTSVDSSLFKKFNQVSNKQIIQKLFKLRSFTNEYCRKNIILRKTLKTKISLNTVWI